MPTWNEITSRNPDHSQRYADRWDALEAQGNDIYGEARLIDAIAPRHATILDAGCGQGRLGGYLAERGHTVIGVDLDPLLIDIAKQRHPNATWHVQDLGTEAVPVRGCDVVFSAGNVLPFIDPAHRAQAVRHLYDACVPQGRLLIGFGTQRGYPAPQFLEHLREAGFALEALYSGWDLTPYEEGKGFLVALANRPS